MAIRAAGTAAAAGVKAGRAGIMSSVKAVQTGGVKALMRPLPLAMAGAAAGAVIAPSGYRAQGAAIGAGLGFSYPIGKKILGGWNALGHVPGAQSGALIAAAAVPVAASVAFGHGEPEGGGVAMPGVGGTMDYAPMSGNMQDRMFAMNATGDLVLGLHGRQHG